VLVGAVVTYFVNVRDRRRTHEEDLVNSAIAAVTAAKAAMMFINNVPPEAGLDAVRAAEVEQDLREAGYRRFVDLTADARAAVAAVVPYRPELARYLDGHREVFDRAEELMLALRAR
jgi:hypothetical protein